jgi:acetate kinase
MAVLAVNAGSSSLKFSLYPLIRGEVLPQVLSGVIEGLEPGGAPELRWTYLEQSHQRSLNLGSEQVFAQALRSLRELLSTIAQAQSLLAVAHRVVHGGKQYRASVVVTPQVLADLTALNPLAPLHQPHNVAGIRAFQEAFADVPQVACFDTAFHATLPELDYRFALPQELHELGLRRYGFHGLSYQYVMGTLLQHSLRAQGRVLMAHLGNGASLCAAVKGQSRATTMGFSALDGLVMGTRTGSLDPGVMLYLLDHGWDAARLQKLFYKQSGLLGVSGISADMRRLRTDPSAAAQGAVDLFVHRVVREAGAMVASIQGLDVLAFSGGIGEHDVLTRAQVADKLGWMGVKLDAQRNASAVGGEVMAIHAPDSQVEVWVVPTDEGVVAAREAARLAVTPD